jgi:hypothetical protein
MEAREGVGSVMEALFWLSPMIVLVVGGIAYDIWKKQGGKRKK